MSCHSGLADELGILLGGLSKAAALKHTCEQNFGQPLACRRAEHAKSLQQRGPDKICPLLERIAEAAVAPEVLARAQVREAPYVQLHMKDAQPNPRIVE